MTRDDLAAAELEQASQRWLAWLAGEVARRHPPGTGPLVLWDVLEEWFASDDFRSSPLAGAVASPPNGRTPAAHAVLDRHRQATLRLLEDLARAWGARDPAAVAGQLLVLVEGAIVGAVVDRHPGVADSGRKLTELVLASAAGRRSGRPRRA